MCSYARTVTLLLLICLHNLHIRPGSGLPARKLGKAAFLPRSFAIENPELLDEAIIDILKLPDVRTGTCVNCILGI